MYGRKTNERRGFPATRSLLIFSAVCFTIFLAFILRPKTFSTAILVPASEVIPLPSVRNQTQIDAIEKEISVLFDSSTSSFTLTSMMTINSMHNNDNKVESCSAVSTTHLQNDPQIEKQIFIGNQRFLCDFGNIAFEYDKVNNLVVFNYASSGFMEMFNCVATFDPSNHNYKCSESYIFSQFIHEHKTFQVFDLKHSFEFPYDPLPHEITEFLDITITLILSPDL